MNRLTYIKNNIDKTDQQLAKDLGISQSYVVAIRKANGFDKKATWTDRDDQWLKDHYPTSSWIQMYKRFPDKTKAMIKQRAYSLGVYREVRSRQ